MLDKEDEMAVMGGVRAASGTTSAYDALTKLHLLEAGAVGAVLSAPAVVRGAVVGRLDRTRAQGGLDDVNITTFNPNSGGAGTNVTLSLTSMPTDADDNNTSAILSGDTNTVTVDNVAVDGLGNGTVDLTIGANAQSGDFAVIVDSPSQGWQSDQSAQIFTVHVPAHQPQITNRNPPQATAGQQVTLTGQNLMAIDNGVLIGTTRATVTFRSPTTIHFQVPPGLQTGQQRVFGRSTQYGVVRCPYMLTVQ